MNDLKRKAALSRLSNEEYVERCRASFLYNSMLSSTKQIYAFYTARELSDSARCRHFNDMAAALIYPLGEDADALTFSPAPSHDSPNLPGPGVKIKIKSIRKDHLSGGSVWTFSNGFKVVYRNMPSDDLRSMYSTSSHWVP